MNEVSAFHTYSVGFNLSFELFISVKILTLWDSPFLANIKELGKLSFFFSYSLD